MTTLQFWNSTACSGHFQAPPESSQTPPKRSLSLLMKIQPWGNSKSARLRAVLGLAGPYSVSSPGNDSVTGDIVEANNVAQAYGVTKGAWLAAADAFSDGRAVQGLQAPEPGVSPLPLVAPVSSASLPRRRHRRTGHASGSDGSVSGADSSASRSPSRRPSRSSSDNLAGAERFGEGLEQAEEMQRKGTPGVGTIAEEGAAEGSGVGGPQQVDLASARNPRPLSGVPGVHWQGLEGAVGSDAEGSSLSDADRSQAGVRDGGRGPLIPSDPSADRHMAGRPPSAPVSPRYIQVPTAVHVTVAAGDPATAAAVLARLRSGRPPPAPAAREPLHPTWLIAPRRAGLTGHNAKGWIPLPSGVMLPFRRPSTSPRTSYAHDSDDLDSLSGLISVTPVPVMPAPSTSPGRDPHGGGPTSPRPTSAAPALRRIGGSSSSRPTSRNSDRVLSPGASMNSTPTLAGVDSLVVLSQPLPLLPTAPTPGVAAAVAAAPAPSGPSQSPVLSSAGGDVDPPERDEPPGAANRVGTLQGPLRGSRMQGHVTAVANPAYYAAAAAAAAATAAAVAGYAPPPGLLREISRRQRLLQPDLAIAGVLPAGSAMSLAAEASAVAARSCSFAGAAAGGAVGASTTPGGGGGGGSGNSSSSGAAASSAGALRPSLTQHRDVLLSAATAAAAATGAAGGQRWVSPPASTVVANGVQGHAVALRPSSAYQALGQAAPPSFLPQAHPATHIQSHPAGSSWGSVGGMSDSASLQAQALALATASSWSGAAAAAGPQPSVVWAATNAALLNQQHRLRQENLGMIQAPTQQRVLLTTQATQQQAKKGRTRRPSLTEFGNARALLQHRPTEGWVPGAAADVNQNGKVGVPAGGGPREGALAASAPCLSTVLQEAAEGRISIGGGEAIGGGRRQSMMQLPLQQPISPGASGGVSEALAIGTLCPPGAVQKRPSSNSRASFNVSAGGGGGSGSNGGSSIGGSGGSGVQAATSVVAVVAGGAPSGLPVGGATAWLSGGVSLLQALAGGSDGPPHRRHHQRHQNRNQQQPNPQQQLLQHPNAHHPHHVQAHHRQSTRHARAMSGAGAAMAASSVGGGGSSGGGGVVGMSSGSAAPFLSMSPGPGRTNVQRSYGRGGRVH